MKGSSTGVKFLIPVPSVSLNITRWTWLQNRQSVVTLAMASHILVLVVPGLGLDLGSTVQRLEHETLQNLTISASINAWIIEGK
jgi:hypothetical protein